jgi:hypothetical protein
MEPEEDCQGLGGGLEADLGTAHRQATCCWCGAALVVGEIEFLRCWVCPVCAERQAGRRLSVAVKTDAHAALVAAWVERGGQRKEVARQITVGAIVCLYVPLPSQVLFEECPARNVLWGGQAGPGKSHGVRWWLYKRSLMTPGHEGLLLRENWDELEKTHLRKMAAELPLFGAVLVDKTGRFPNGAFIDCGHMADVDAVKRYLSTEYGAIVPDEASQTPVASDGNTPLAELATRARKVYRDVQGRIVRPRFMPVSNPGGPSAPYLCDMFVDGTPDFERYPKLKPVFDDAGIQIKGYRRAQWVYIPARLDDNPYQDEAYEDTLAGLNKTRYEQLRHGDWHVFSGQFFGEWTPSTHVAEATLVN